MSSYFQDKEKSRNFYRYNLKPGECFVNEAERKFAFDIAYQHPNARSGLDKLADDTFKHGLLFMQAKQILDQSFEFEKQIKRDWIRCGKDSIFAIAAQGVLPLYRYRDKNSGELITSCPQYETYKLSVRYEKGQPVFRFWWINTIPTRAPYRDYVDKSVKVMSGFGYDPRRDGSLNSLVSSLFSTVNFMDSMLAYATRAENKNTDPTMIVAEQPLRTADMSSEDQQVSYNFFVDADPCKEREEDMFDEITLEARLGREAIAADAEAIERQRCRMEAAQEIVTASIYNRLQLRPGQTIANQPLPRPRGDLVNLIAISKKTVCEVFKIPEEIFSGGVGGKVSRDTTAAMVAQYRETLRTWARYLEPIMTFIYRSMYEAEDERYFRKMLGKNLRQLMPHLEHTLSEIRVIINISQGLTTADLEYAVNRGLLHYKVMAQHWLIQNGLPKELLANEEDILSDQTKRQLLLGIKNTEKRSRDEESQEKESKRQKNDKEKRKKGKEEERDQGEEERKKQKKEREKAKK